MSNDDLQRLIDRAAIQDVLVRHALAQDDHDWAALAACYVPEATYAHPGGQMAGVEEIVGRARTALSPLDGCQHLVGTTVVTVGDGAGSADEATAVSYFQAQHVRRGLPDGEYYIIAGSYRDRFVRGADGVWRIAHRQQAYSWRDGNPEVTRRAPAPPAPPAPSAGA